MKKATSAEEKQARPGTVPGQRSPDAPGSLTKGAELFH